ncbi:MAG: response regulator [Vicinamibacteria bacterium]|nr:response regulator [Vicinamibacteria bacterium]
MDDDRSVLDLLVVVLRDAGFSVDSVDNGKDGLRAIEARRPDLLLLDVIMPGMNAWSFLRSLQAHPPVPPVIVISGEHASPRALGPLASAVCAYIPKPFAIRQLVSTCHQVIAANAKASPPAHERRSEPRRLLVVGVTLMTARGQPVAAGYSRNLSRNGAQIDVGASLEPGLDIRVALHLPDYWEPLTLSARVMWRESTILGVRFFDPTPEDRRRLRTLLGFV